MKGKLLKLILIVSLILNFSILTTAGYIYYRQTRCWVTPFQKIKRERFLFEKLSLRPEQQKAMKEMASRFHAEKDRRRQAIIQKRKMLLTLMRTDTHDQKAIDATISEISRMQEDMQKMIVMHILEEKSILDKDQQKKFLDLIEDAMTKRRQIGGG